MQSSQNGKSIFYLLAHVANKKTARAFAAPAVFVEKNGVFKILCYATLGVVSGQWAGRSFLAMFLDFSATSWESL
ncbi:MAG: hypothetical protein HQL69_21770 [Magnetococcales bacterium]|nr:hypothetical protein [Magnetococcales bacterium]